MVPGSGQSSTGGSGFPSPEGLGCHQSICDGQYSLLENAPDAQSRARLMAASTKESGAWLNALPISSLGLRMDDNTIRESVGFALVPPSVVLMLVSAVGLR